ncbi:hypothetical protein CDFC105_90271 [Clostridioides difficile]|nr:hypothetical protein [Clostridioides difficile]MBY2845226.1 hypothetical protein [Clostridioides difficile]CZR71747.1 hypothetical protein CDFC105_00269 [Clostridioides difficile]CZR83433.1 hypothetical protein CDFC105_10177 [Clostridioides difficile]CZS00923.1 hypothetical protein CDFC105_90271 [Clostridioides difficile]HBE8429610.1 hypothetical protein [Clostridioides difficile]
MIELEKKLIKKGKVLDTIKSLDKNKFDKYMELVKKCHKKENKKEGE